MVAWDRTSEANTGFDDVPLDAKPHKPPAVALTSLHEANGRGAISTGAARQRSSTAGLQQMSALQAENAQLKQRLQAVEAVWPVTLKSKLLPAGMSQRLPDLVSQVVFSAERVSMVRKKSLPGLPVIFLLVDG